MFAPTVLGTGLAGYTFLSRTRDTQQAALARSPQVSRDTDHFREKLSGIQTAEQLMEDRTALRVALGAFGLDEDIDNTAFIRKILESDLGDSRSLANRLADKRYLAFAKAFGFGSDTGPSLDGLSTADDVSAELAKVQTADDLLNNTSLLRATLDSFGLGDDMRNTYFLKKVLESDLSDPGSFANSLSDTRYAELSKAFDLGSKLKDRDTIYGYARAMKDEVANIRTPQDLFDAPDLLKATLDIFGLGADIDRTGFLTDVLTSDLSDPASVANAQEDQRYAAMARAFGFAERAAADAAGEAFTSVAEKFVTAVNKRTQQAETPAKFFEDITLTLATFDFFAMPVGSNSVSFANRILTSDRDSPTSLLNVFPDTRYRAFADAFNFKPETDERTYPPGFADAVVQTYLDRQFEIAVGEADATMRIALSLDRTLGQVNATGATGNARWFGVMASNPLREVFETVFNLPSSFGTMDIDRQLGVLKERADRMFGTDDLTEIAKGDRIEDLRRRFLVQSSIRDAAGGYGLTSGNIVSMLLADSQGGGPFGLG